MTGCKKEDVSSVNAAKPAEATSELKLSNVKLENGMLVFNTKADMDSAFKVVQKGQSTVSNWLYTQFPGFVSQIKAYNALTRQDSANILQASTIPTRYASFARKDRKEGEDFVAKVVETSILANLVNKDGFISYADKVLKLTYDKVYEINKDAYLKSPTQDFSKSISSEVKTHPVTYNIHYTKEANTATPRWNVDYFTEYTLNDQSHGYRTDKRWSGILYDQNWWFGHFVEATTRYEGKLGWFGSWVTDQAASIGVNGYITIQITQTNDDGSVIITYSGNIGFPNAFLRDKGIVSASLNPPTDADLVGWQICHSCYDYEGVSHYRCLGR